MRVHDFEHNQVYSASVQYIREMLSNNFSRGAKECYRHLGEHIEHTCIDLASLKETDSVEIWDNKMEIIQDDGIKIAIERVN